MAWLCGNEPFALVKAYVRLFKEPSEYRIAFMQFSYLSIVVQNPSLGFALMSDQREVMTRRWAPPIVNNESIKFILMLTPRRMRALFFLVARLLFRG